jgi:tetratricopeptide (TPR) repeat protein
MNEFRCLSVRQPYAWAILSGVKKTENRTWTTPYRGTVVLHASSSQQDLTYFRSQPGCAFFATGNLPAAALVGFAELVAVTPYGREHEADPFAFGPYCWTFANARSFVEPIPLKGKLNLFKVDDAIADRLRTAPTRTLRLSEQSPEAQRAAQALAGEPDPFGSYLDMLETFRDDDAWAEHRRAAANRLIELYPEKAVGFAERAYLALENSAYAAAISDSERALGLAEDYLLPRSVMALAYWRLQECGKALECLDELIARDPHNAHHYLLRGDLWLERGDSAAALDEYRSAIGLEPECAMIYGRLAEGYLHQGTRDKALWAIQQALALKPEAQELLDLHRKISLR